MQIGTKVGPQTSMEYLEEMIKLVDFFEIYGKIECDYDFLSEFDKPIVVHAPHFGSNKINFSNSARIKDNLRALEWARRMADKFSSKKIIIHAERKENENCSIKNLVDFIKNNYDSRMLIENMPFSSFRDELLCTSYEDIKLVMETCKVGFCLDILHVIEYAAFVGTPFRPLLKKFLSLKPLHFHLSDCRLDRVSEKNYDENQCHLNLFDGNIDLNFVKSLIPENASITLETPQNIEKQKKEIAFLRG